MLILFAIIPLVLRRQGYLVKHAYIIRQTPKNDVYNAIQIHYASAIKELFYTGGVVSSVSNDGAWYLVQCKPRDSFRAESHLINQGYVCFHPTHVIKKKVAGSIQSSIQPLFPYYLFIWLHTQSNWSTIRSTRGVSRIVTFNSIPAQVPIRIIDGLKFYCERRNKLEPEPLFKKGDRVLITQGCFKDLEAIVTASKGEERVVLLLNLFHREQQIELGSELLVAC